MRDIFAVVSIPCVGERNGSTGHIRSIRRRTASLSRGPCARHEAFLGAVDSRRALSLVIELLIWEEKLTRRSWEKQENKFRYEHSVWRRV